MAESDETREQFRRDLMEQMKKLNENVSEEKIGEIVKKKMKEYDEERRAERNSESDDDNGYLI